MTSTAQFPMDDMGRRTVIGALATLILALSASAAFAHCFLDHSMPPSASVMTSSPSRVVLYFDNQFNPDASTVRVLSENGDVVSGGATASSDDRALIAPLRSAFSRPVLRQMARDLARRRPHHRRLQLHRQTRAVAEPKWRNRAQS
jgi:methionine-rich copper-binding protein CopC